MFSRGPPHTTTKGPCSCDLGSERGADGLASPALGLSRDDDEYTNHNGKWWLCMEVLYSLQSCLDYFPTAVRTS